MQLKDISTQAQSVKNPDEAKMIIRRIDEYIDEHETNQLNALGKLSEASRELFSYDTSVSIYSESITVFDTFLKTKAMLVDYLRDEERKLEELKRLELEAKAKEARQRAPEFATCLKDGHVQEGEQFVFQCAVNGQPMPNVEWFKNGISINDNSDYKTTFNNGVCTLTIEETMLADTASFHCRASNSAGQTETFARLVVTENEVAEKLVAPVFSVPLATGFARDKSTFAFECAVIGNPLPTVQWFRNNICIDQLPDYTITFNNGHATMKILEVCPEDQTTFTCRAMNQAGQAETSANLLVQRK